MRMRSYFGSWPRIECVERISGHVICVGARSPDSCCNRPASMVRWSSARHAAFVMSGDASHTDFRPSSLRKKPQRKYARRTANFASSSGRRTSARDVEFQMEAGSDPETLRLPGNCSRSDAPEAISSAWRGNLSKPVASSRIQNWRNRRAALHRYIAMSLSARHGQLSTSSPAFMSSSTWIPRATSFKPPWSGSNRAVLLVIETPNIDSLPFKVLKSRWRQFIPEHYFFFNPKTMSRLMRDQGLDVQRIANIGKYASLSFILNRLSRYLSWPSGDGWTYSSDLPR